MATNLSRLATIPLAPGVGRFSNEPNTAASPLPLQELHNSFLGEELGATGAAAPAASRPRFARLAGGEFDSLGGDRIPPRQPLRRLESAEPAVDLAPRRR